MGLDLDTSEKPVVGSAIERFLQSWDVDRAVGLFVLGRAWSAIAVPITLLSADSHGFIAEKLLLPTLTARPRREHLAADAIVQAMKKDKKRTGNDLALVMLQDDYTLIRVNDLTESEVSRALGGLAGQAGVGIGD